MDTKTRTPAKLNTPTWEREVVDLLDLLNGGLLRRLDDLATSAPTDAAAFAALAALLARLGVADAPDPASEARRVVEGWLMVRQASAGGTGTLLVRKLAENVERLVAAGVNDESDPWVPRASFPFSVEVGGRVLGLARGLPATHPCKTIDPFEFGSSEEPHYVLGPVPSRLVRLSQVRRLTDAKRDRLRREHEERRRREEFDGEARRRAWEQSPQGQVQMVAALAAELEQLRAGTIAEQPAP